MWNKQWKKPLECIFFTFTWGLKNIVVTQKIWHVVAYTIM